MGRRYLIGPVTSSYAEQNLLEARQAGDCRCFGFGEGIDLVIRPGDSWAAVREALPGGWQPDFLVLYLAYTTIPAGLWSAPVPIVGLAADWNLLYHGLRRCLPHCDLVFTDTTGVEALAREGMRQARIGNLYGCE